MRFVRSKLFESCEIEPTETARNAVGALEALQAFAKGAAAPLQCFEAVAAAGESARLDGSRAVQRLVADALLPVARFIGAD